MIRAARVAGITADAVSPVALDCWVVMLRLGSCGHGQVARFEVSVDISAFYAVVAGINFTLLGLWWVAVLERADLRRAGSHTGQMAYVVSLQFLLPGTVSLLSQVAPNVALLWRTAFVLGGAAGVVGIVRLVPILFRTHLRAAARLLLVVGVPIHTLVAIVAILPDLRSTLGIQLNSLQVEAVLFCLLVLVGAQTAWIAAMSPSLGEEAARGGAAR